MTTNNQGEKSNPSEKLGVDAKDLGRVGVSPKPDTIDWKNKYLETHMINNSMDLVVVREKACYLALEAFKIPVETTSTMEKVVESYYKFLTAGKF